jgi:site-specific DNA-methyltransferase (adenine-specific)
MTLNLFNADCLEKMKDLSDNSIDLIIADLPYGELNCKWDSIIDLNKMWIEFKRLLKPNGQSLFFCSTKFGNTLINSNPKWYRSDIVWEKNTCGGFLQAKKTLLKNHEMIYLFHNPTKPKDLKWTYNPQMVKGEIIIRPIKTYDNTFINKEDYMYGDKIIKIDSRANPNGLYYPKSVLKINSESKNNLYSKDKKKHPTQKPVELYKWLLNTYSNEGDMVLDPTFGSCNSGAVCRELNRNYIGIEMNKEFYDKAVERLLK